ncbi:restriction endonuclease subunit S [Carnobacteriaceae bacterium zg-84]|nr:restriction endonuclease subunit S [Carnobacteriaceae bacterium zg-84]
MVENNKKIPKRRFKQFKNADAWEQRKLEDFGKSTGGTSIESEFDELGKYKVISIGSYSETNQYTDQGIRANKTKKTENRILNKNNLTMILNDKTASGNIIGRVLLIDSDNSYIFNQRTERIEVYENEYLPEFLYQFLNADNIRGKIICASQGNTQIYVNWTSIRELTYEIPVLKDEQRKIADLFNQLDNLIAFHQRKLNKLKTLKKAHLSEMFPAEGERVPKRRFSGFFDDWEQQKLGEIGTTYSGLSGKTKEDFGHGKACFIPYMNIFSNPIIDLNDIEYVEIDEKQNEVKAGDVFFTTSSEIPEEVGMTSVIIENKPNTYLNSFCFGYRPIKSIDNYYLTYMLRSKSVRKSIAFLAQGISRYNISKNKVMGIEVPLTTTNEQQRIGAFFRDLDHLIALHQRKLEKLKNLKKAYLNELFV